MGSMKIGIDIDGVLADFTTDYGELLVEVSGRNLLDPNFYDGWKPETWYFERAAGYTKEEEAAAWKRINKSEDFWYNLAPLCPEINLQDLCWQNDVYFITNRTGKNVKEQTEEWLQMIYDIYHPTVLISANKGPVVAGLELDIFIDDRDKNLWAVKGSRPECQCFVLDYPYNQDVEEKVAKRIQTLSEVICDGHLVMEGC